MSLEDTVLSEMGQTQDKYCMTLYEISKIFKFIEAESRMMVSRDGGKCWTQISLAVDISAMLNF